MGVTVETVSLKIHVSLSRAPVTGIAPIVGHVIRILETVHACMSLSQGKIVV